MVEQAGRDNPPSHRLADRWYHSSGPPGEMRWLAEGFCHNLSAAVSGSVRAALGVRLAGLARSTPKQFTAGIEELTCSYVLTGAPNSAGLCVEFSPGIASLIAERLMGASAAWSPDVRPLTSVERGVLRRVAESVARSLSAAWPVEPRPDLHAARRCAPLAGVDGETEVVVATFELSVGEYVGTMRLCADAEALGNVIPPPTAPRVSTAPLELSAGLEGVTVENDDLAGLAPGDLIATDTPADGEVIVRVGGIPKFAARLAAADDRRFLTITRRLNDADPPEGS